MIDENHVYELHPAFAAFDYKAEMINVSYKRFMPGDPVLYVDMLAKEPLSGFGVVVAVIDKRCTVLWSKRPEKELIGLSSPFHIHYQVKKPVSHITLKVDV